MQQHGSKYWEQTPHTLDPLDRLYGVKFQLSEHGHVAYQVKGNHEMQQHGSKYFARRPLPTSLSTTLGVVSIGHLTFSEHGHVAYQIKWDHKM